MHAKKMRKLNEILIDRERGCCFFGGVECFNGASQKVNGDNQSQN